MRTKSIIKLIALVATQSLAALQTAAGERVVLIGPKTIGPGWKDKIVIAPEQFDRVQAGDVLTVYTDNFSRTAQGSFQNPDNWQPIAENYKYFGVSGSFRLLITEPMVSVLRQHGVSVGGHDYRILYASLTSAADYQETWIWKGPAVRMGKDWSGCAEIKGKALTALAKGDALRLHLSKAATDAAVKIMDLTWNPIDPTVDGAPVSGDTFDFYIPDDAPLIKIAFAGGGDNTALRIGGKDYQLDAVGIVKYTGTAEADTTGAQRAPHEYVLPPGELFHGEQTFPLDWSGNARFTAEAFQHSTVNDVLVISYRLMKAEDGAVPQMSLRENRGKWTDLGGAVEPQWLTLDGSDLVYTFDDVSLDRVKTRGFVITGRGFTLTKVELLKVE